MRIDPVTNRVTATIPIRGDVGDYRPRGSEASVDLADGKTLSTTALKDVGAGWLMPIDEELWFTTPTGEAVVVQP